MESTEFKKILFKTAFCVMACDGHIDNSEIEEMKKIDTNTSYFNDMDLSAELNQLIEEIKSKGKTLVKEFFETIRDSELTIVQELLILEISFRIISADNKIDENELKFLNLLRSKLNVDNEVLMDRFGNIPYFRNMNRSEIKDNSNSSQNDFIKNINLPEISALEAVSLKKEK